MVHRPVLLAILTACAGHGPAEPADRPAPATAAWAADEAAAFARARAEHRGVLIEFWTAWAAPCAELASTLRAAPVEAELARAFVPVRFDVSADRDDDAARRARYQATTLPALVFVAPDGRVVGRVDRVLDAAELVPVIRRAAAQLPLAR
jgi:thiol:disulfide interchange protein